MSNTNYTLAIKSGNDTDLTVQIDSKAKLGGFLFTIVLSCGDAWIDNYSIIINGIKITDHHAISEYFEDWDLGEEHEDTSVNASYFSCQGYGHYYKLAEKYEDTRDFRNGAILAAETLSISYSEEDENEDSDTSDEDN